MHGENNINLTLLDVYVIYSINIEKSGVKYDSFSYSSARTFYLTAEINMENLITQIIKPTNALY
jgi:hypothetical protein